MTRAALAVLLVVLAAGCGSGEDPGPQGGKAGLPGTLPSGVTIAAEDTKAPHAGDFDLTLLDGTRVKASKLWATRPVVVDFTASWCERCSQRQSMLNGLAKRYRDEVAFLAVAHEDKAKALKAYLGLHHVPYAAAVDGPGKIWRQYAVDEPPVLVVIGKGGRLLRGWTTDVEKKTLEDVLDGLTSRS